MLVLVVEPVILQRIDDLGNVGLAEQRALNHLRLASALELSTGARISELKVSESRPDIPSREWTRGGERLPLWQQ